MLIHPRLGSYSLLGALLVDEELEPDPPFATAHCGTCTACLDACPTDAFAGPGWLDSRRCVSYLTIELRGPMPEELRPGVGDWLFGCDICQEVCPWNRKAPAATTETLLTPGMDLETVLKLSAVEFQAQFGGTALERTGYDGLRRNAAIVLGNVGQVSSLPALRALLGDQSAVVREAAEWAIGMIESRQCVYSE